MSQSNQATATAPQETPGFWAKHHDIVPIFIIALMAFSFLFYWKADPHSAQYMWGKYFFMPLSNFLLFMYIFLALVAPVISKLLAERHVHVSNSLQSFAERSDEIAQRYREVKEKLEVVDDETDAIVARAKDLAETEKAKILKSAQSQAERIKAEAETLGSQEVRRAQQELQTELIDRAFQRAEDLLASNLTADDKKRLETDFLQHVGKLS